MCYTGLVRTFENPLKPLILLLIYSRYLKTLEIELHVQKPTKTRKKVSLIHGLIEKIMVKMYIGISLELHKKSVFNIFLVDFDFMINHAP